MPPKSTSFLMPEYILNITRHAPNGSRRDKPVRVITFHRDDLLPSNQDSYDGEGNLESQVSYSAYKDFGGHKFPTRVVIKRPLEGITIVLTVEKVDENQKSARRRIHRQDSARHTDPASAISRIRASPEPHDQTDPPLARPV